MNNKKEKRKKRIILITTVSIVLFSTVSLLIGRSPTKVESILRESVTLIEYYVIKKPLSVVGDIFNEYYSLKDVYEENAVLKEKLENYTNIEYRNKVLMDQLDDMKKQTDMKDLLTDYLVKITQLHSRPWDGWSQQITIGLGSKGGVKEGMPVMSDKGMIGVISSVSELYSTVSLLTDEKRTDSISVEIHNGEEGVVHGLLERFNANKGTYEISLLENIDKLSEDAYVTTSGYGKNDEAPKGLPIGKAVEISTSEDGISKILHVEPAAEFHNLNFLSVVLKKIGQDE